jgi:hypothetical protein
LIGGPASGMLCYPGLLRARGRPAAHWLSPSIDQEERLMHSRLLTIGAALGLIVAGFVLARQSPAQGTSAPKGLFSTLKVGQMVRIYDSHADTSATAQQQGTSIIVYEDPAMKTLMTAKITEIGTDFIAWQVASKDGTVDVRFPATSLLSVLHVKPKKPTK